ncbi:uncharacterized protein ACMZJ9_001395 [Mantella aurantiaca]
MLGAVTGLLCLLIISVSSEELHVQRESDFTVCNMKCHHSEVFLELYRERGGEEKMLLLHECHHNHTMSREPRLRLDTGSGCWKLTPARKDDFCVYKVRRYKINTQNGMSSTDIPILDPVLIYNITSSGVRLGQDTAVRVQFSGEESHVTWEEDGEPLPERYRLIDDNRTLIIPSVQRDDAERILRVRITNPVSEEIREHQLKIYDPVLISNITSNFSRLGQDTAVSVNFSGEESHVTWEVDGLPLPERYRLIDDNRTLIIPSVQRDDAERTFRVRITNPVSEEIREYQLEMGDYHLLNERSRVYILVAAVVTSAVICVGVTVYFMYQWCSTELNQDVQSKEIPENGPPSVMMDGSGPIIQNGFKASSDN